MMWSFKESEWEQCDGNKVFKLKSIFGEKCENEPHAPLNLLLGAKTHPKSGRICEKGLFPPHFNNCPYCGLQLDSQTQDSGLWIPPYGTGNGLKISAVKPPLVSGNGDIHKRGIRVPLPSRDGRFAFCSVKLGAKSRLLIAIQRDTGQLWVFRPEENARWRLLSGNTGGDSLPTWSWSLSVDSFESGMCMPSDQGPAWVIVDWHANNIKVDRALGRSIGGSTRLREYLMAPVSRENVFAMVYRRESDMTWSDCPSNNDPKEALQSLRSNGVDDFLGVPVIDENRQIAYWPGRCGYIRVSGADSGNLNWEFRPWETDEYPAVALIELGPPYRKTGSRSGFWQLCEDRDHSVRDGIINKIIKLDGDERIDSEKVDCGQFITTGRSSFSWSEDYWDDLHKRIPGACDQTELRFPLIQFGDKGPVLLVKARSWEGRDELGIFSDVFYNQKLKTDTHVRLVVEGSGLPERPLYVEGVEGEKGSEFRLKVSQIPEVSSFIYGESLYVYLPENNDCFCWPIEFMGA